MKSRRVAKISLILAIVTMVVALAGFIATLVLNAFVFDEYDAYGEVPIPGSGNIHLPAGDVTVSLHVLVVGSSNGGLPVPPLGLSITPPVGVPKPEVTESSGSTTTINNDAHVRVWNIRVASEGNYDIRTEGQVSGYINPRLAFGHQSSHGNLVWVFVALFVVGLVDLALSIFWLSRTNRIVVKTGLNKPYLSEPGGYISPLSSGPRPSYVPPPSEPTGEGVRVERLKTLASLRDSGALTEEEFQAEKRRILEGY